MAEADIDNFVEEYLSTVQGEDAQLMALITLTPELAKDGLRRALAARLDGRPLVLDGMPIACKDNIDLAGVRGTVGSSWFFDRVSEQDALVVDKLRAQGAAFLATTNMHELAYGGTSSNPHFGFVRNPWSVDRIPGGSSGGSAVAVACDWVVGALGTDTGGSVRCPAAMTGITGLRPTHGSVSNEGVFPLADSFDTVGFMARAAQDVERLLRVASSSLETYSPVEPRTLRIGLPSNTFFEDAAPSITLAVRNAGALLSDIGHELEPIEVPEPGQCDQVARALANHEAFVLHEDRLRKGRDRIGADVAERLELGANRGESAVRELRARRRTLGLGLEKLFNQVDILLLPTIPVSPAKLGAGEMLKVTERSLRFTYMWGIAGLPALSFPCGFDDDGMPVGAQLIGPRGADLLLCEVARQYQSVSDWHLRRPRRPFRVSERGGGCEKDQL